MSGDERYVTSADGTVLWAQSAGDPSKPAVVFVHGLACTALGFDKQFSDPGLLRNLYLVRYELRGHGRTTMREEPEAYESGRFGEDFKAICDAFGLVRPFLLGWSMGGCVVVDVVNAYGPSFVSGVIYIGGGVLSRALHRICIHPVMVALTPRIISDSGDVIVGAAEAFVDSCVADPATAFTFQEKLVWMGGYAKQSRQARIQTIMRKQDETRWRQESKNIPVLIVQGTEDLHCLYDTMIGVAREIYADVDVKMMDGVGHAPHFERPKESNAYIFEFTQKVNSRKIHSVL